MGEFHVHRIRFYEYSPCAVHCLAYDDNEQKLALSRSDGNIEIWSISDNWFQEKILPGTDERSVEALIWCNNRLFSAGLHGFILEHDLLSHNVKHKLSGDSGAIWCLALNDNKTQIAAGTEEGCVILFNITTDGVEFHRALDRQEGRILSLAFYEPDKVIVTGGVDNLRIWSMKSGHAIQRLTPGRQDANTETIVWAVAITDDFTIVSGDSRGKVCFWNGRHGTQIKTFSCNRADVLCLCVTPDGTSVFASGVEPIVTQFEFVSEQANSDWKRWMKTTVKAQHTHDVRALVCAGNQLVSAGVDTRIISNKIYQEGKSSRKIQAFPHQTVACMAHDSRLIMFKYSDRLDVWRLGRTNQTSELDGEILQLRENCMRLLELKSRGDDEIVCADISPCGRWIAYSDLYKLRLFRLNIQVKEGNVPTVSLTKVSSIPAQVLPAHRLCFTANSTHLLVATCTAVVQMVKLDEDLPTLVHTFQTSQNDSIHLLTASKNGKYFACANHASEISIYHLHKHELVSTMPKYKHQPVAMAFHPVQPLLVVVYADNMIYEYDLEEKEYSDWSRQFKENLHHQWSRRHAKIVQIMYSSNKPHQILLRDQEMFCIIDKRQRFPNQSESLFKTRSKKEQQSGVDSKHCFHICNKYQYLLHVDLLADNSLVIAELTPSALTDTLPVTLKVKKFGT